MNFNNSLNRKSTETIYSTVRSIALPVANVVFKPIIFGTEHIPQNEPIVFAPNHRKTKDAFVVVLGCDIPTHWVALKRFFDKEDSLFNNSKNPILCHLTSLLLNGMGAIPVDRGGDTTISKEIVNEYLKLGSSVGIFPEGGTNKNPELEDIAMSQLKSGFVHFAKNNDVYIEPVSLSYIPGELGIKHKVIINYREPYKVGDTIKDGLDMWVETVRTGLKENETIINYLKEIRKMIAGQSIELKIK